MKKSALLTILVSFISANIYAQSETETVKDGLRYVLLEDNIAAVGARDEARDTITSVVIPDSVEIGGAAVPVERIDGFSNCKELNSVILPTTIKEIAAGGFKGCEALKTIELNEGIESIGAKAFSGCVLLEDISIPSTIALIDELAFLDCTKLSQISISENNKLYDTADGVLIGKNRIWINGTETIGTEWNILFCPPSKKGEFIIGDSICGISPYAFCGCNDLKLGIDKENDNFILFDDAIYGRDNNLITCAKVEDGELTLKKGTYTILAGALDGIEIETLVFPYDMAEYGESNDGLLNAFMQQIKPVGLKKIVAMSMQPPIYGSLFEDAIKDNATLVIPDILKDCYMKFPLWNGFKNVEVVATNYSLYPMKFVIANHEETKRHYFSQYATYITPKTGALLSLLDKHPNYLAGDNASATKALANAWHEYMESGKSETYKARSCETVECIDGTIYLLDEIDDNDFMNFMLQGSVIKVAEEKSVTLQENYTNKCTWEILDCNHATPNGKYMEFRPTTSLVQPSAGIDFSDMPLLADYPYEISIVTIPDNSGKDYKIRVRLWNPDASDYTNFMNQSDKKDFIMAGDRCDTLKLEHLTANVASNIILQIYSNVSSSELEQYTRTLRIASVSISPKSPAEILPSGIEKVETDSSSSNPADFAIYDLTGRRLNGKPTKGMYIQGGKKYIAK